MSSPSYFAEIKSLIEQFTPPDLESKQSSPSAPAAPAAITIPEDFCIREFDAKFSQICSQLNATTTSSTTEEIITTLDYLLDSPLRDHYRFLPYLQRYAGDLLGGCARQLERYLTVEYPKLLLAKSEDNKLYHNSCRLLQLLAIVSMNLIIWPDINQHISVTTFTQFYSALLLYRLEALHPQSAQYCYTLLYLITDDTSLWIETDCTRDLAPGQFEAIFATIHKLLQESKGTKVLTEKQWNTARILFGDVARHWSRIVELIKVEAFLKQANAILKAFPESAFSAEHNFQPLEILASLLQALASKKDAAPIQLEQQFPANEPIVAFATKVLADGEILKRQYVKCKRQKVVPDEVDLDGFDFGSFCTKEEEEGETPKEEQAKLPNNKETKVVQDLECLDDDLPKKKSPEPTVVKDPPPPITTVPLPADPIPTFLEQINRLSTATNRHQVIALLDYFNRNLEDFLHLYPGVFEAQQHLNNLICAMTRYYVQQDNWAPFNSGTALLKRIFKYSHLVRTIDFEVVFPQLLLSVPHFHYTYDIDYGSHALREVLFSQMASIGHASRLIFTLKVLVFTEEYYYESSIVSYETRRFFLRGLGLLTPAVGAHLGQIDQILKLIGDFMPYYEEDCWRFEDSSAMERQLDGPLSRLTHHPHDAMYVVRKLLWTIVKTQGESIWSDYHRAVGDLERQSLMAKFIRLALDASFKGQEMCTRKDELAEREWPVQYQCSDHAASRVEHLQESWNWSSSSYPDTSVKMNELKKEILPKLKVTNKDIEAVGSTLKSLRKHLGAYSKNPSQFGGPIINKLFGASLELLKHYVDQLSGKTSPDMVANELKETLEAILRLLDALLNIEHPETNAAVMPYPKYQLSPSIGQYADLLEAVLALRYHLGVYWNHNLMKMDWLLSYKPNSANILAAAIHLFNRAAKPERAKDKDSEKHKATMFRVMMLASWLGDYREPNNGRVSREERIQVLVKRFRNDHSVEVVLQEAGQFLELFKGSFLEHDHLYTPWQIVQELLYALVMEKSDYIRAVIKTAKESKKKPSRLIQLLEQSLKRLDVVKVVA